jgi:uncharacterized membrane protein
MIEAPIYSKEVVMASPASIAKHPIHPMLVAFPIGLLVFSLICDLIQLIGWGGAVWADVAFYTMAGGIVGALLAAVPGLIDLFSLSGRPKTIGIWHMCINLLVVVIFVINFWLRMTGLTASNTPILLSVIGVALLGVSGWLGGQMVYVHGVAVEPQDSPRPLDSARSEGHMPKRVA